MRIEYLVAIVIAAFVAGTGLAGHSVQSPEAVRIGLLTPAGQPAPPAMRLAARLAESVDPFLGRSGG